MSDRAPGDFRSGFAAVVGRPNVGKSTLVNALVGEKVAITSPTPETTRRQIRGIFEADAAQVVLVDTPGLHRPRTLLGERLNDMVRDALADVDAVLVCLPTNQAIGPGDRFLLGALPPGLPKVAAITKIDLVKHPQVAAKLVEVDGLADWAALVPVSARRAVEEADAARGPREARDAAPGRGRPRGGGGAGGGRDGIGQLAGVLAGLMPAGPRWFPDGEATDEPVERRVAELVREAALAEAREELPHSIAAQVEEFDPPRVRVALYVERDSQKGIVIGAKGARLKQIGTEARRGIETLVGRKVHLEIHVKVAKGWQRDPKALNRLGF
jgi:GTP-binding protein Era